ncbi:DUF6886 family protein [Streptomyces kunmingensis]|nr:DUF6886 family protein [Streptomyces kunmingensis]
MTAHQEADKQRRLVNDLWTFRDAVTISTLSFSGIRLHNATPR